VSIKSYRDLLVWQKAMDFVLDSYRLSRAFPESEKFGLATQLQRAAVSIPANIAEGRGRHGTKEFMRHLSIARGSLCECETHLLIASRLEYIGDKELQGLLGRTAEIGRMINALLESLRRRVTESND
jgi:four helix bundle protein